MAYGQGELTMSGMISEIQKDTFDQEVLQNKSPVMIEFYADWCKPCKMMLPSLEILSESYRDKIKILKINIEQSGDLTKQLGISSVPAVLFFKNGEVVMSRFGLRSKQDLEKEILEVIKSE